MNEKEMEGSVRSFLPYDLVKHFKRETVGKEGNPLYYYYKIIGTGFYTQTNELVMIYEALYWPHSIFVRPYDMFMSEVDKEKYPDIKQKYRFELVTGEERTEVIKHIPRR